MPKWAHVGRTVQRILNPAQEKEVRVMSKDTDKAINEMLGNTTEESEETKTEDATGKTETEATASDNATDESAQTEDGGTDWKAEARKWESRAKENKEAADRLTELENTVNELNEQLEAANAEREQAVNSAALETTRWKIAAKHKVSEEDVELFLTASDEETLEKQAQRLSQNSAHTPKPDAAQGKRNDTGPLSATQQGAAALEGLFN